MNRKSSHRIVFGVIVFCLLAAGSPATADLISPSDTFPPHGGKYVSVNLIKYGLSGLEGELVQMELSGGSSPNPLALTTLASGQHQTDSFFDVFVEVDLPGLTGQGDFVPDSFFDVFVDGPQAGAAGLFDTEIVAMSLSASLGGQIVDIRESPRLDSTGETTITDLGNGQFHIESFFDVFTELSVDGGQTWLPASDSVRMQLMPAPSAFAAGVALVTLGLTRRRRHA